MAIDEIRPTIFLGLLVITIRHLYVKVFVFLFLIALAQVVEYDSDNYVGVSYADDCALFEHGWLFNAYERTAAFTQVLHEILVLIRAVADLEVHSTN